MRIAALLLTLSVSLWAESFPPAEVAILGDVEYGTGSGPLECPAKTLYCAVVFNGNTGDRVEVTVKGGEKPFVALADGSLKELARGETQLKWTLPDAGQDIATYYIVFRDTGGKPARWAVTVNKLSK